MEKELNAILREEGKEINFDKVDVDFENNSIWIEQIDEEGYNLYGETYYSAYKALDRLKELGALEK